MIQQVSHFPIFVSDQDEALDFYVGKLGFEKTHDQTLPNGFRWLTVRPPGQDINIILALPQKSPRMTDDDLAAFKGLIAKGAFGACVFRTADCRKTYEELTANGVEFSAPPKEEFYGVESVMKDPFGNWFSVNQPSGA